MSWELDLDFGKAAIHIGGLAGIGSYAVGSTLRQAAQAAVTGYVVVTAIGLLVMAVILYD